LHRFIPEQIVAVGGHGRLAELRRPLTDILLALAENCESFLVVSPNMSKAPSFVQPPGDISHRDWP